MSEQAPDSGSVRSTETTESITSPHDSSHGAVDYLEDYCEAYHRFLRSPEGSVWARKNTLVVRYIKALEGRIVSLAAES